MPRGNPGIGGWEAAEREMDEAFPPLDTNFAVTDYLQRNTDIDFEFVVLQRGWAGDPPRWFIADYRDGSGYPEPWVCIHSWTASPASLLRNLCWTNRSWTNRNRTVPKIWIFEARNKGQIAAYLEDLGYTTKFMGKRNPTPAQERTIVNSRERALISAEAQIARAQAKIDRLMSLPEEPTTDDPDGALAVWFLHRFSMTGRTYTYGAVKASDDKWYTTGPASPKGYTWDELVEWHFTEANEGHPMYVASEWDVVQ